MNSVPNMNEFGAAERSNIKKVRGLRGSKGGGSNLASSPEFFHVYGFFFRGGKTDSVQFKGRFAQRPFCLQNWAFCRQFSPLRYRIFISLEKATLSFKSPSPKPHLNRTGSAFTREEVEG